VLCRFVLDTCRHLKEKKSYMVYTAAGCLGMSALIDIIKEVLEPYDALKFSLLSKFTLFFSLSKIFCEIP